MACFPPHLQTLASGLCPVAVPATLRPKAFDAAMFGIYVLIGKSNGLPAGCNCTPAAFASAVACQIKIPSTSSSDMSSLRPSYKHLTTLIGI